MTKGITDATRKKGNEQRKRTLLHNETEGTKKRNQTEKKIRECSKTKDKGGVAKEIIERTLAKEEKS